MQDGYGHGGGIEDVLGAFYSSGLPLNKSSNALASSLVAFTGYCYLISFTVLNTNVAAQFIQLHDARDVPANGAIPAVVFTVAASSNLTIAYTMPGRKFLAGLVLCNSSTAATKTGGAADCFYDVQAVPVSPT